ncbi:MAG: NAD(P)/FAD-dependent oxidoreductase [Balneolaceae bacterium]
MVIGIIGAGIAGLTAGRHLSEQGHDVTILEKSSGFGGRMATRYAGDGLATKLDHGLSFFAAESPEFQAFVADLLGKGLVQRWGDDIRLFDGNRVLRHNPNTFGKAMFTAVDGMNSIGKYLSRWVDVRTNTLAGGLTHIGSNRRAKRAWMINLSNSSTFEADAVILALPAPQAYGILNTTVDEINTLKIIREIDEVNYTPCFSLMAGYGNREQPDWEGIACVNSDLDFIANEGSKKSGDRAQECSLVVHASAAFTRAHYNTPHDEVKKAMMSRLQQVIGDWAAKPEWSDLHRWRFSRAEKVLDKPFFELEFDEAPLALIGDYYQGNTVDAAYNSGLKLAAAWNEKFAPLVTA